MSNYARWERESQEPLGPLPGADEPRDEQTIEFDVRSQFVAEDASEQAQRPPALAAARESLSATASRVGRWFAALDRRPEYEDAVSDCDPADELAPPAFVTERGEPAKATQLTGATEPARAAEPEPEAEPEAGAGAGAEAESEPAVAGPAPGMIGRTNAAAAAEPVSHPHAEGGQSFPTAPLGYNRHAVDQHIATLERELGQLRARAKADPPMSVAEELERIGEQTASILVVAHDKAHETTRMAEQQAQRAIKEAEATARRINAEAERRLRELDEETDAVWRERERLLDDLRTVSATLTRLADEAAERFPADEKAPAAG